jgi:hypothetical protein
MDYAISSQLIAKSTENRLVSKTFRKHQEQHYVNKFIIKLLQNKTRRKHKKNNYYRG